MKTGTLYFSHDANAKDDEKCLYLISKEGMFGYGLYWALVEMLHQAENGRLRVKLIPGIAHHLNVNITDFNRCYGVLLECGLLLSDDIYYWSERVLSNKKVLENYREKRSEAGKKGMAKRWNTKQIDNDVITKDNIPITENNKEKEKKIKETKLNKIKEIKELSFPSFANSEFTEVWEILIKEKKWKNKSPAALQMSLDKLGRVGNVNDAIQMMRNSISGGWQGLFEINKNKQNGNQQQINQQPLTNKSYPSNWGG